MAHAHSRFAADPASIRLSEAGSAPAILRRIRRAALSPAFGGQLFSALPAHAAEAGAVAHLPRHGVSHGGIGENAARTAGDRRRAGRRWRGFPAWAAAIARRRPASRWPERSTSNTTIGRSAAELKQIAADWLRGEPPPADRDADQPFSPAPIDDRSVCRAGCPITRRSCEHSPMRDQALDRAVHTLAQKFGWSPDKLGQFRQGAIRDAA